MCKQCELRPVYEFTNQRKLCSKCFVKYFQKKFLYVNRKFGMIRKEDVVGYENKKDFRSVVLEDILEMFAEKLMIEVVELRSQARDINKQLISKKNKKGSNGMEPSRLTLNYDIYTKRKYLNVSVDSNDDRARMAEWLTQLTDTQRPSGFVGSIPTPGADENYSRVIGNSKKFRVKRGKLPNKIAVPSTIDSEANEIIRSLIKGKIKDLKEASPITKPTAKPQPTQPFGSRYSLRKNCRFRITSPTLFIKPLYLFLDKEVLLYAKLKGLRFKKRIEKKDKINSFIDELEEKHPEVKRAVVNSYLKLYN